VRWRMIRKIIIFSFFMFFVVSANANECKELAKKIVSLDDRVKNSTVNPALVQTWQAKLKDMRADFADKKCDPKLIDAQLKAYNDKRINSGK